MLKLTKKKDGSPITSFGTYQESCLYSIHEERSRILLNYPNFYSSFWGFHVLSPGRARELITTIKKRYDEETLLKAWREQTLLLDMCEGDPEKARQIPLDGKVNLEALREDWCKDYFEAHGMRLSDPNGLA